MELSIQNRNRHKVINDLDILAQLRFFNLYFEGKISAMPDYDNKKCYICGSENADSDDHVPPKNLFLKKYRKLGPDLITVPAHEKCNKSFEKDDEYFRYFVLIPSYWENERARELWDAKIKKQIHRPQSEGFRQYLLNHIGPLQARTLSGIKIGDFDAAYIDVGRVEGVIERTSRGIYYKKTKTILPLDCPVSIGFMKPQVRQVRNDNSSKFSLIADGIFRYACEWDPNDNKNGMYWFVFFESVDFWVFTGNPANRANLWNV